MLNQMCTILNQKYTKRKSKFIRILDKTLGKRRLSFEQIYYTFDTKQFILVWIQIIDIKKVEVLQTRLV